MDVFQPGLKVDIPFFGFNPAVKMKEAWCIISAAWKINIVSINMDNLKISNFPMFIGFINHCINQCSTNQDYVSSHWLDIASTIVATTWCSQLQAGGATNR